jgi:nucleoside-diphosphate-sugar epimerase
VTSDRVLVTGSGGCIGAWAVSRLVREGTPVAAYDLSENDSRLRLLLNESELGQVERVRGDIRDKDELTSLVLDGGFTHIVHLAGLQVPFCAADPALGSQVNVTGTINVFEAVRNSETVRGLSYASSIAVFGRADLYENGIARDDSPLLPATLYGTYKQANEGAARVYSEDWGVGSVGLRPCIVYGAGRDQGLTSDVTKAMLAAAASQDSHIAFGGSSTFQHADDMAATFIEAARLEPDGALIHNVPGPTVPISEIASLISVETGVNVSVAEDELPLPKGVDGTPLSDLLGDKATQRPIKLGIVEGIDHFRRLLADGRLSPPPG